MEWDIYKLEKEDLHYKFCSEGPRGKIVKVISRPNAFILIKGSSSSRTRLYQMKIAGFWAEVSKQFEILGEFENEWLPFQKGMNYKRFLVYKK